MIQTHRAGLVMVIVGIVGTANSEGWQILISAFITIIGALIFLFYDDQPQKRKHK